MDELIVEDRGPVRILRLNRPDKRNSLNTTLTAGLLAALRNADSAADVRAIVLCGAGPSFCAGADLKEFSAMGGGASAAVVDRAALTADLHKVFSTMATPVVGAVHGHAMGGGAGLAVACDLLVLADTAVIGYPELKHGIVAAIVMANLVRQVGRKAAFELVALAQPIDAARAVTLGLANRVVPAARVLDEALALADVLARHDATAMATTKRLFHRVVDLGLEAALDAGRDVNVAMRGFDRGAER